MELLELLGNDEEFYNTHLGFLRVLGCFSWIFFNGKWHPKILNCKTNLKQGQIRKQSIKST
jgi:hypothetical protein